MKYFKINQKELFDKVNSMFEEFEKSKTNEDKRLREIAQDFDMKYFMKKDKSNPLLEEKVVRLQELAMQTRDQLDAHIMDFSRKLAQFSTTMLSSN